jgi:hypothetical protein
MLNETLHNHQLIPLRARRRRLVPFVVSLLHCNIILIALFECSGVADAALFSTMVVCFAAM